MKSWALFKKPFRIALLLSPSLLLVAGCVHERVEYVTGLPPQQPAPVPQPAPQPVPAPAPAPGPILRGPGELDRMLAPIALYPDPLTAQILPAATVPDQVADASAYLRYGRDPGRIDYQPWDQSVKALTRYPDVLSMLAGNLPWTTDLGIAFENQPSEVFDSIQRLRAQARNVGDLRTTPEQVIIVENSIIQIVPANPRIIYVPVYQPEIVYVRPPPAPGRINVHFNQGRPIGPWLNHDVDWRDREVIVWKSDHARPQYWWYEAPSRHPRVGNNNVAVNNQTTINNNQTTINNNQTTINNNQTTINNNYTVWRPHGREAGSNNNSRATREPDNRPNQNQNPPVAAQPSPRPGSRNNRVTPLPGPEPVNTQNPLCHSHYR